MLFTIVPRLLARSSIKHFVFATTFLTFPSLANEFKLKVREVKTAIEDALSFRPVAGFYSLDGSEFITEKELKEELFAGLK